MLLCGSTCSPTILAITCRSKLGHEPNATLECSRNARAMHYSAMAMKNTCPVTYKAPTSGSTTSSYWAVIITQAHTTSNRIETNVQAQNGKDPPDHDIYPDVTTPQAEKQRRLFPDCYKANSPLCVSQGVRNITVERGQPLEL